MDSWVSETWYSSLAVVSKISSDALQNLILVYSRLVHPTAMTLRLLIEANTFSQLGQMQWCVAKTWLRVLFRESLLSLSLLMGGGTTGTMPCSSSSAGSFFWTVKPLPQIDCHEQSWNPDLKNWANYCDNEGVVVSSTLNYEWEKWWGLLIVKEIIWWQFQQCKVYAMTFCMITNNQATHMPTLTHHMIKAFMVEASKPSLCYLLTGAHSLPTVLLKQPIQPNFGYNPPSTCLTIPPRHLSGTRRQSKSVIILQNFYSFMLQACGLSSRNHWRTR